MPSAKQPGYQLETVSRSCALVRELNDERRALTFSEIVPRTGMGQTICFRLLGTLEGKGFLRRSVVTSSPAMERRKPDLQSGPGHH